VEGITSHMMLLLSDLSPPMHSIA